MQRNLFILCLFLSLSAFSQKDSIPQTMLKGQIIHAEDNRLLSAAHVLNLNTVQGTITNDKGYFELPTKVNDTILVSYLGYSSIKIKITNDLLKADNELSLIHI